MWPFCHTSGAQVGRASFRCRVCLHRACPAPPAASDTRNPAPPGRHPGLIQAGPALPLRFDAGPRLSSRGAASTEASSKRNACCANADVAPAGGHLLGAVQLGWLVSSWTHVERLSRSRQARFELAGERGPLMVRLQWQGHADAGAGRWPRS